MPKIRLDVVVNVHEMPVKGALYWTGEKIYPGEEVEFGDEEVLDSKGRLVPVRSFVNPQGRTCYVLLSELNSAFDQREQRTNGSRGRLQRVD